MSLRATLLELVATPDRAWLTFLAGSILLAREFVAPGRVVPGVLGGLGLVLGVFGLTRYPVSPVGVAVLILTLAILVAQAWWPSPYPGAVTAAAAGTVSAQYLLESPFRVSLPAALVTAPVAVVLAWLIFVARRAFINKVRTADDSSR